MAVKQSSFTDTNLINEHLWFEQHYACHLLNVCHV